MQQRLRILVVEDNPINIQVVESFVERAGYEVLIAEDGATALAMVQTAAPNLILMDLQLPGIDGFEVTLRLKADPATRTIPIIAVTAYAMVGDEARARAAGCYDYITKPINRRVLLEAIARHLPDRS